MDVVRTIAQVIGVPIALMIIGVYAKRLGRRDGDDSPRKNDWAVDTTLLLMLLGTVFGDLRSTMNTASLWWLIGVIFATMASMDHDRFRSWERNAADGTPTKTKRMWIGVVGPDVLCIGVFVLYQAYKLNLL